MSDNDNDKEQKYEAWMQAGQLKVGAEGESSDKARENTKEMWEEAIQDLANMPEEERNQIGLK